MRCLVTGFENLDDYDLVALDVVDVDEGVDEGSRYLVIVLAPAAAIIIDDLKAGVPYREILEIPEWLLHLPRVTTSEMVDA